MTIDVSSASYEHGNYFKVSVEGEEVNIPGDRGIGLVIVEKGTKNIKFARMFDTYLDPSECSKLNNILLQVAAGNVIIMGVKDDGSRSLTLDLIQTITALGSKYINQLGYRDSWAMVVKKGKPHTAKEKKDDKNAVRLKLAQKKQLALRNILISSAGFSVGNNFSLVLNDQPQQGISYHKPEPNQRGIVMIVLDPKGKVIFNDIFDVWYSLVGANNLEEAIRTQISQSKGNILILGVKDEGSRYLTKSLRELISSLGSKEIDKLGYRDSWCFMCRIGKENSAKEGRSNTNPVTLTWVPKQLRSNQPPNQRYTIHYHPPNPSAPLSSSLPNNNSNSERQQIPASLSHRTHPPLHCHACEHHPPQQNAPPKTEGETLLHHRANQDKGIPSFIPLNNNDDEKKGRVKRCNDKECNIEHSPSDIYHHPHPSKDEKLEKYDKPPVQSVHYKNTKNSDAGVEIGTSVRNNRARRRDTIS